MSGLIDEFDHDNDSSNGKLLFFQHNTIYFVLYTLNAFKNGVFNKYFLELLLIQHFLYIKIVIHDILLSVRNEPVLSTSIAIITFPKSKHK